jgi:hypothetical protein
LQFSNPLKGSLNAQRSLQFSPLNVGPQLDLQKISFPVYFEAKATHFDRLKIMASLSAKTLPGNSGVDH